MNVELPLELKGLVDELIEVSVLDKDKPALRSTVDSDEIEVEDTTADELAAGRAFEEIARATDEEMAATPEIEAVLDVMVGCPTTAMPEVISGVADGVPVSVCVALFENCADAIPIFPRLPSIVIAKKICCRKIILDVINLR